MSKYFYKKIMTEYEMQFLEKIKCFESDYIIIPQVNLLSIITKFPAHKFNNELFRNIDFGIFDKSYNLILLIELNDNSHNDTKRKRRDLKVRKLCMKANIELINFYSKFKYTDYEIITKINDAIIKVNEKNISD